MAELVVGNSFSTSLHIHFLALFTAVLEAPFRNLCALAVFFLLRQMWECAEEPEGVAFGFAVVGGRSAKRRD